MAVDGSRQCSSAGLKTPNSFEDATSEVLWRYRQRRLKAISYVRALGQQREVLSGWSLRCRGV